MTNNNPFNENVNEILKKLTTENAYQILSPEVLLHYISNDNEGAKLLKESGVKDLDLLLEELDKCNHSIKISNGRTIETISPTPQMQDILEIAVNTAFRSNRLVSITDLLAGILSHSEAASSLLKKHGVTLRGLINGKEDSTSNPGHSHSHYEGDPNNEEEVDILVKFTINLNEKAKEGKFDTLIGRKKEVDRTIQTLARRRKNNPLLIGEPGVGKTAIAEGLAKKIVEGEVPEKLKNAVVYSLDVGSLLAGTKFRGDFEQRMKAIMKRLEEDDNAILFIDEIHTIVGAGAASGGQVDAANILKPALANGTISVIGATTYKEKGNLFDKDAALSRRFQVVDVAEPSQEETLEIIKGIKAHYEEYHNVKYTDKALEQAVALSVRYLTDRHLPDKAIDVIDEAGALQNIIPVADRQSIIKVKDIEVVIANMAKLPPKNVESDEKMNLRELKGNLEKNIFGQDEAISVLNNTVMVARAGLGENGKTKPMGTFLFTGPTGVGKTEVCNQLSQTLGMPLLRFDMSEYMEKHTVAKLIGAPAGYVGYDEGGKLTDAVSKKPYSIVLFDEIEKADPSIFNITLQIMDYGFLTDSKGKTVDFRNTIVVFTTNTGATAAQKNKPGFVGSLNSNSEDNRNSEINNMFTPEFRNRLDRIVNFKPLTKDSMLKVVDKKLAAIVDDLKAKKVEVSFSDSLREHLLEVGFDPAMGARPIGRKIQEIVSFSLAEELLFGKLQYGGSLEIDFKDGKAEFKVTHSKRKPREKEVVEE